MVNDDYLCGNRGVIFGNEFVFLLQSSRSFHYLSILKRCFMARFEHSGVYIYFRKVCRSCYVCDFSYPLFIYKLWTRYFIRIYVLKKIVFSADAHHLFIHIINILPIGWCLKTNSLSLLPYLQTFILHVAAWRFDDSGGSQVGLLPCQIRTSAWLQPYGNTLPRFLGIP